MRSSSPRDSRILMHVQRCDSLPRLVNWVHHISINVSINKNMSSVWIIKGIRSWRVSPVILTWIIIWRIILERRMRLILLVWRSICWVWMMSVVWTCIIWELRSLVVYSHLIMMVTRQSCMSSRMNWDSTIESWLCGWWILHILNLIFISIIFLDLLFLLRILFHNWEWIVRILVVVLVIGCCSRLFKGLSILWRFIEVRLRFT